ncbi:MAG: TIGR00269 family protein, partial [Candidatus Anstonellaceae archaeon]
SMLKKGDRVAVGVSGGKDSCVMLHMLHKISKSLPFTLHAITIDEGIAGYRNHSLEVAKGQCRKLGIPLKVISFHKEYGKTLDKLLKEKGAERSCSFCGVMRRYALNKAARQLKATKLAIGHNSDDVAQTVFMNFMRNEPDRLGRFGPISGAIEDATFIPRIKPLFLTPERDVAAYAVMKGIEIEFMECPYARHAFRQYVRQMLNEAEVKYPGTKLRIVKAFLSQQKLLAAGVRANAVPLGECKSCGEPSSNDHCNLCLILEKAAV